MVTTTKALAAPNPPSVATLSPLGSAFVPSALAPSRRSRSLRVHGKRKRKDAPISGFDCISSASALNDDASYAPLLLRPPSLSHVRPSALFQGGDDGDGEYDKKVRRRRRRNEDGISTEFDDEYVERTLDDGNAAARALASSISFLSQPLIIPVVGNAISVPLLYPLSTVLAVVALPPITGGLFLFFSGLYLILGSSLLGGDAGKSFEEFEDEGGASEVGDDCAAILPLASFAGAVASSALLSPQGLLGSGSEPAFSLTSPLALAAVGLGMLTIVMGIKDVERIEQQYRERERRYDSVRKEKSRMDRWDEDIHDSG